MQIFRLWKIVCMDMIICNICTQNLSKLREVSCKYEKTQNCLHESGNLYININTTQCTMVCMNLEICI